jgi:hypothetical protein
MSANWRSFFVPEKQIPLWRFVGYTNTNPHRSMPTQQDWQVLWLGLVAQVWWFQIKQA